MNVYIKICSVVSRYLKNSFALILLLIHIPDELQGKIFHLALEYSVKSFILLHCQVMFPVSNGT